MEETRGWFWKTCKSTPRDRRNQRRIKIWTLIWTVTWLAVLFAISQDWLLTGTPAIVASLVPIGLGVVVLFAYRRFLREADELRRKIELEALALAFGVGVVGGMLYVLLWQAGAFVEADVLDIVLLMIFTYGLGVFFGERRYA